MVDKVSFLVLLFAGGGHQIVLPATLGFSKLYLLTQSWALSVFLNIFNNNKQFFCIFHKVTNLFLHQSYLKSPLPVKLT